MSKNKVAVYITGHGFGHLTQTIEMLIALYQQKKQIQFKIITSIPESVVTTRIANKIPSSQFCYIHDETNTDIGMPMIDAMQVDQDKAITSYKSIHSHWESHLHFEEQRIKSLHVDLVLSNVSYIPLQAAANLGIPSVALCSLDWASIWQVFGSQDKAGKDIFNQIVEAYQSANYFLQLTPHLPMLFLENAVSVPFVVRQGESRREVIDQHFPQCLGKKLILISMGGMDAEIDFERWPKPERVVYIVTGKKTLPKGYLHAEQIDLDFSDIMASVDMVLTKTGYGMVVETVVNQTPLFYIARADWPENEVMFTWCEENNRVLEIDRRALEQGLTEEMINKLLSSPAKNKVFEVDQGPKKCVEYIRLLMQNF